MSLYIDTAFDIRLNGYGAEIYSAKQFMSSDKFYAIPINDRIKLIKDKKYPVKIVFDRYTQRVYKKYLSFDNLNKCYDFISDLLENNHNNAAIALNNLLEIVEIFDTEGEIE